MVMEDKLEYALREWEEKVLKPWLANAPERKKEFKTRSIGIPVKILYVPSDIKGSYISKVGFPGTYPYTRGIYPTMYRGALWTIRQYSGYGTPEETNQLFKNLLEWGETGLSLAFDLPTQCGYDSDHPLAEGEVGRVGVAVNTLLDMKTIFKGIPLNKVSTSMTINATAPIMLAMYIATAESYGVPQENLKGTIQNDVLKEFVARNAWMLDVEPSLKLAVDVIEYCNKNMPKFNPISVTDYHFREAGADGVSAAAFMFADAIEYIKWCEKRGLMADDIGPRISFFVCVYIDFFEEIARLRAMRRLWAKIMKDELKAKNPSSWRFRFAANTGGSMFTRQLPILNLVRGTVSLLAMVLGGVQSAWVSGYDEAYEIPSPEALKLSIRLANIIAEETNVTHTVDPLAGSYYIEWLTDEIEKRIEDKLAEINQMGGALECIKRGYYTREILKNAYEWQKKVESGEIPIVGMNIYPEEEQELILYQPDPRLKEKALESLKKARSIRDVNKVKINLNKLRDAAEAGENLMPYIIKAVKSLATVGEISSVLREVYGEYKEKEIF
jgi:methylmalonyl-CoA mutase N-terminal domain/subunit